MKKFAAETRGWTGHCNWATPMSDVTRILAEIEQGDTSAADRLLPLVYEELRQLAARSITSELCRVLFW